MNETLEVNVTQDNIDSGIRECPDRCPIAQAIKFQYGSEVDNVHVDCDQIVIDWAGLYDEATYSLPIIATDFVIDFDKGRKVLPFQFSAEFVIYCNDEEDYDDFDF